MRASHCRTFLSLMRATTAITTTALPFLAGAQLAQAQTVFGPDTPGPYTVIVKGTDGSTGPAGKSQTGADCFLGLGVCATGGQGGDADDGPNIDVEVIANAVLSGDGSSPTVLLSSTGGQGGTGGSGDLNTSEQVWGNGGPAGNAGSGGNVNLHLESGSQIASKGGGAVSIAAIGGAGGKGGKGANRGEAGAPSDGGGGGDPSFFINEVSNITLAMDKGATVTSDAAGATAIFILGQGANGADAGDSGAWVDSLQGPAGGGGGNGGGFDLNIDGVIASQGSAVLAIGQGGNGAKAGDTASGGGSAIGGSGGYGGYGGFFTITLGQDARISAVGPAGYAGKDGSNSNGETNLDDSGDTPITGYQSLLTLGLGVQSLGGLGGHGGSVNGSFSDGGLGGGAGPGKEIAMDLQGGAIATSGYGALGVLALSAGGSGGDGAAAGGLFFVKGGNGAPGGDGRAVTIQMNAPGSGYSMISTAGDNAEGLLAMSVGGGGGYGGDVSTGTPGIAMGLGAKGANGGSGGAVTIRNGTVGQTTTANQAYVIATAGAGSRGVVGQSIGGGGGRGGNVWAAAGGVIAASMAIGGDGGTGGDGGAVSVSNFGIIQTLGYAAIGVDLQSVGGGGGFGGAANSYSAGSIFTSAVAVGGSGGTGGVSGNVALGNFGQIITQGNSAVGVRAQSIGGGGGHGGTAIADAISSSIPDNEEVPSVDVEVSVGGRGGKGGNAGTASQMNVVLVNTGLIATSGDGAMGAFAQSVGGGGGYGGDAGTVSMGYQSTDLSVHVAVGGSGGAGGDGNAIWLSNGGLIATLGYDSTGVSAQSVGGGGGQGGGANVDAGTFQGSDNLNVQLSVGGGGDGGGSGSGGDVTVRNFVNSLDETQLNDGSSFAPAQGGIFTYGDLSSGISALSVGGGGGNGGGANVDGSGGQINVNVAIGGNGGSGGNGGKVMVENGDGAILTAGAQAAGIHAMSVGGGGGQGGAAATGPGDDPEILASSWVAQGMGISTNVIGIGNNVADWKDNFEGAYGSVSRLNDIFDYYQGHGGPGSADPANAASITDLSVDVGGARAGKGGAAGAGGAVSVTSYGDITTLGAFSSGIEAISIGGGGGSGGAASPVTSNDEISSTAVSGVIGIGGKAGSAGDGGEIDVTNTGTITTSGDLSYGIFAQTIGGGGGTGGATAGNAGIGGTFNIDIGGGGGAQGQGGDISIDNAGGITTAGDDAIAIVAQTVGGGGGLAMLLGRGIDPNSGGPAESQSGILPAGTVVQISIPGSAGANSHGGDVIVNMDSTVQGTLNQITTKGRNAYGILAQSIGGGGGLVVADNVDETPASLLADSSASHSGDGGTVHVTTFGMTKIGTQGDGAVGILAQSIGGGGGIINGMADVRLGGGLPQGTPLGLWGNGQGGNVTVDTSSDIITSGAYAHGIFAQSAGGGGGVIGRSDGSGYAFSGMMGPLDPSICSSCTGDVTANVNAGTISVSGIGSYGVALESLGSNTGDVTLNTATYGYIVTSGQAAGAVLLLASGTMTVNNAGKIDASASQSQVAVEAWGNQNATINNSGIFKGSVLFNGTTVDSPAAARSFAGTQQASLTLTNSATGKMTLGAQVQLGAEGQLVNHGELTVGASRQMTTASVAGQFVQGPDGRLILDADHAKGEADVLHVTGHAVLAGMVEIRPTVMANRSVKIFTADGGVDLDDSFKSARTHLFRFDVQNSGNELRVQPQAEFVVQSAAMGHNRRQVATHLQELWDNGSSLDKGFTALAAVADANGYARSLDALSGQAVGAIAAFRYTSNRSFVANMFNACPLFKPETLANDGTSCGWARAFGSVADQDASADATGYHATAWIYQMGGQKEVAPGLFVGGSVGYESSRFRGDGATARMTGDNVLLGATLRYQAGPWQVEGALDYAHGWYRSSRSINVGGFNATADARPTMWQVGGHMRLSYTQAFSGWYLQPRLDLHLSHMQSGRYTESGADIFSLAVDAQDKTVFTATPALEIGGRVTLGKRTILTPFASLGADLSSNPDWAATARFVGQTNSRGFRASTPLPDRLVNVAAGADLAGSAHWSLRLQYSGAFAEGYAAHSGLVRLGYSF